MAKSKITNLARLDRLIDSFIPAEIAREREARQRARMFLMSHLFGPFIGNVVPAALFVLDPHPGYDVAVLALSITAFWIYPFVLRATGRYTALSLLSIQNLVFCILWSCYFNGGVTSPTLPWVLTIPLLAFFYVGRSPKLRLCVLAIFAANFATFVGLCVLGLPAPKASVAALQGLGIVSTIAASAYVAMMALYYAKIRASGVELESEMKGHLSTAAELRRATTEAERAGAAKAEFLAKMSHELRTPLNAVIGYSQILLEDAADEGDEESAADLERIHGAGNLLLRLVNGVLDLSKIEAGKMELYTETVDVAALVTDSVEGFRSVAARAGNTLSLELDGSLGTAVCDAKKTQQALAQVLDNAAKFTARGAIVVSAERVRADPVDAIVIKVRDTGIGIAPVSLGTLFEKFSVADDATSSKYGGTGLGLALALRLCQMMGGDIAVDSTLGVGSCFSITLPVVPPASANMVWVEDVLPWTSEADWVGGAPGGLTRAAAA